jgi:hypothetical protein
MNAWRAESAAQRLVSVTDAAVERVVPVSTVWCTLFAGVDVRRKAVRRTC